MRVAFKQALRIFIGGFLILAIAVFIAYQNSYRSILNAELRHTAIMAGEAGESIENDIRDKIKWVETLSLPPIVSQAVICSNEAHSRLGASALRDSLAVRNDKWMSLDDPDSPFIKKYTRNELAAYLGAVQDKYPDEFGEIFVTDKYGALVATSAKLSTYAHAYKYWWQGAYDGGKGRIYIDDRGYDISVGDFAVGIVVPIRDSGELIGFLKANLKILGSISEIVDYSENESHEKIKLIRGNGEIIYRKGQEPLSRNIDRKALDKIRLGDKSAFLVEDAQGRWLVSYHPVHLTLSDTLYGFGSVPSSVDHLRGSNGEGWYVLNYRSQARIYEPLNEMIRELVTVAVIMIFLLAIMSWMIGHSISRPLGKLMWQTERVIRGDMKARVEIDRKDEIGQLALSFNTMMDRLNKTTTSIQEKEKEIRARKKVEAELRERESDMRLAQKISSIGSWKVDLYTKKVAVSDEARDIYGLYDKDLDLTTVQSVPMRKYRKKLDQSLKDCLEKHMSYDLEFKIKKADTGEIRDIHSIAEFDEVNHRVVGTIQDITDRRRMDRALKKSEDALKNVYEAAENVGFVVTDIRGEDTRIMGFSRGAEKIFGYQASEVMGEPVAMLHTSDDVKKFEDMQARLSSGKNYEAEMNMVHRSGRIFPAMFTVHPRRDENGKLIGTLGVTVDISERKEMEDRLRSSEQRLQLSLKINHASVFENDLITGEVSISPDLFVYYGYSESDIPVTGTQLKEMIHPDDYVKTMKVLDEHCSGLREDYESEFRLRDAHGMYRWVHNVGQIIDWEAGRAKTLIGISRDISHFKSTEEALEKRLISLTQPLEDTDGIQFEDLFNMKDIEEIQEKFAKAMGVSSIITRPDGTPLTSQVEFADYCTMIRRNPKGMARCIQSDASLGIKQGDKYKIHICRCGGLWDASSPITVGGRHIANWMIGQVRNDAQNEEDVLTLAKELGLDEDTLLEAFHRVPVMSKERFETVCQALFSFTRNLSLIAYQNVQQARFITEKKRSEEQLKEINSQLLLAKDRAEESDKLKSAFLANMSHEIRTPMNGILGFANLLNSKTVSDAEQKQYLEIIENSGKRMLSIINDLIDISRIESGQVSLSRSRIDMNMKLSFYYQFFKLEAGKKGLELRLEDMLSLEDSMIFSDEEKLVAVLVNLIKNAIKYTESGFVGFGARRRGNDLFIFVKDSGIGIPKEKQESIFKRFIQADLDYSRAIEGAGLGLSITQAYVDMLGGDIRLESEPGKGSCFTVRVPYESGSSKPEKEKDELVLKTLSLDTSCRILIAEDDAAGNRLLQILLEEMGIQAASCYNGLEAVEYMKEHPETDVILMDVKMPEMDGYTATRKIREFNRDVYIIAQTAYTMSSESDNPAIAAGCNDVISKPVRRDKLIGKLNSCLKQGHTS